MTQPIKIAIVISRFNEQITKKLLDGALSRLMEFGIPSQTVKTCWVPGAVEIPLIAKRLAKTENYEAIICLGTVIQGQTNHYDYVCEQVSLGCQQVALEYEIPIIFGILTTQNKEQAFARAGGDHGNKGAQMADAAMEMIQLIKTIET